MARPNSKYFASVIAKLIAAKRQEYIAIDQSFKMQLREELIQRATGLSVEKRLFDWGEFFSRWRYPVALVPSALLLMLVVSQVMKLPVVMQSEVSVPLVSSQQETAVPSKDIVPFQDGVLAQAEPQKTRIKTFPGALVMPKKVLVPEESRPQVSVPTASVPILDLSKSVQEGVSDQQVPVSEVSSGTLPAQGLAKSVVDGIMPVVSTFIPDRTGEQEFNTTTSFQEIRTLNDSSVIPGVISEGKGAGGQNQMSESVTNSSQTPDIDGSLSEDQLSSIATEASFDEPAQAPVVVQPQQLQVSVPVPQIFNATPLSTPAKIAEPTLTLDKVPAVQETTRSFPVFYQFDMLEKDRSGFERVVLPSSIDSKDVSHAVVIQKDDGVIELQVFFNDSTSLTSYYKKNAKTGAWDSVEYVTRYYYDTNLQYSTDVRYLPSR